MSQHTPTATPWHTESGVEGEQPRWIVGAKGEQIAQCYSDYVNPVSANAAFIVRACNSHDALVEALKGILEEYRADCEAQGESDEDCDSDAYKIASAAIAKAEGRA